MICLILPISPFSSFTLIPCGCTGAVVSFLHFSPCQSSCPLIFDKFNHYFKTRLYICPACSFHFKLYLKNIEITCLIPYYKSGYNNKDFYCRIDIKAKRFGLILPQTVRKLP